MRRIPAWSTVGILALAMSGAALAQDTALSDRAKARDANGNGFIDRNEAGGPLQSNFDTIDADKNGKLDGAEIRNFFRGGGGSGAARASAGGGGGTALSGRAKAADKNGDGFLDKSEARGPLQGNFDKADKNKDGKLDGTEIRAFFRGGGGRPPPSVVIDRVIRAPASETYPVYGRLVARQMGVISARVRGAVGEMKVHVGDRVAKGDVIAKLVSDTLQSQRELKQAELVEYTARVRTARAQVALAKQELNRLQRLKRSAAFSQARFEDKRQDVTRQASVLAEANAKVDQAQAELKMANIDLAYATIRAPFSGVVSKRHTDVGAYLGVGNPVVTLINDHALEVEAEVPSIRLRGLDEGTVVTVEFEDGRTFKATVRAIVPEENPLARTRTVRFSADLGGNGDRVAVNQSARLIIPTGPTRELVTVHKDAILQRGGGPVVYVIESNQAKMRPVKLGQAFGGRFEVREGLKPGEMVVVRGNERLRPGQRVRIRPGGSS